MFNTVFKHYVHFLLKKEFANVYVKAPRDHAKKGPRLYAANHSSWWDALIIFYVNASSLHEDAHGMMAEDGLKRFPFFKKIGAFPVGQSPKKQLAAFREAAGYLTKNKGVWLFAQGKEQYHTVRPLGFETGIGYLKEKVPHAELIPVAITYAFRHQRKPDVFIWIGEPVESAGGRKAITRTVESAVESMLDDITKQLEQEDTGAFQPIIQGRKTIDERIERSGI